MGLQDVFFQLRLPFDATRRARCRRSIAEEIYFHALTASVRAGAGSAARTRPSHETRAAQGELQFDAWGVAPDDTARWDALRDAHQASTACATRC